MFNDKHSPMFTTLMNDARRPEAVNRGHFRLGSFADYIDPERTLARYHTQEDEFWRAR